MGWAIIATLVITLTGLGYWAVEKERQLSTIKTEKDGVTEEGTQAESQATKLGQVAEILQSKLDDAEREIQRLNDAAAEAEAKTREYETQGHPYYATARLWDDGIIDPIDMRRVLALGISASLNAPVDKTTFGVFRM